MINMSQIGLMASRRFATQLQISKTKGDGVTLPLLEFLADQYIWPP